MKLTKRKGFNFFRSYWDVYNELDESNKLAFIDSLLNKQFLNVDPKGLEGMAKFAYISQTNSIDNQVKGYNDKMKALNKPLLGEITTPTDGGVNTPAEQVEEKGKEKVEGEGEVKEKNIKEIKVDTINTDVVFKISKLYDQFSQEVKNGNHKLAIEQIYMRVRVKPKTLTPILKNFQGQLIIDRKLHKNTHEFLKHFSNYVNTQDNIGKLDEYKTFKQAGSL